MKKKVLILIGMLLLLSLNIVFASDEKFLNDLTVSDERVVFDKDSSSGDIKMLPSVEMYKWGDETSLKLWSEAEVKDTSSTVDGKLILSTTDEKIDFIMYELPATEDYSGAMEYEVVLKEKPLTNVIELHVDVKGLTCYYQPPLNEDPDQELKGMTCNETYCYSKTGQVFRPDNVVGSYACYHENKHGASYESGKAFHIYRPKIIDADKNWIWGTMNIKQGILSITIDEKWLDSASYPVIIDPTFGYTSAGASFPDIAMDDLFCSVYQSPSDANANIESIFARIRTTTTNTVNCKAVAVLNSTLAILTNGVTPAITGITYTTGWTNFSYTTAPAVLPSTYYALCLICTAETDVTYFYYDATGNISLIDTSNSYTTPANPTDGAFATRRYSIYAWYNSSVTAIPPSFSVNTTNQTATFPKRNETIQLGITVKDDVDVSCVKLATNVSGAFVNTTTICYAGASDTNITVLFNETVTGTKGTKQYQFWANDSANNGNLSDIYYFSIKNSNPSISSTPIFVNGSGSYFHVNATAFDIDGGTDIVATNITSTSGTCQNTANSTSLNYFTPTFMCSGTALMDTTITIGFTDAGGAYVSTSGGNTYAQAENTTAQLVLIIQKLDDIWTYLTTTIYNLLFRTHENTVEINTTVNRIETKIDAMNETIYDGRINKLEIIS